MAGKGGGAWKVAYADFVTAMMAFFLVMWICGQDGKVRRSVADYFSDPMGSEGSTTKPRPGRSGSLSDNISTGSVPLEEKVATGQGRGTFTGNDPSSKATTIVFNWIQLDADASKYWHKQASDHLEAARWSKEVREEKKPVEFVAARQLRHQLHDELKREIPNQTDGVYRNLLHQVLKDVNWDQLAQDLLKR